jgi:type VI secretion system protein ImpF
LFIMPRTDNEVRVKPSVLDRLLDYEPELTREAVASRARSLRELKDAVRRDLEWLLNTRQAPDELPAELKELNNSLAAYGVPDFTSFSIKSSSDQNRMRRAIEAAITIFEPRLEDPRVTMEPVSQGDRLIRFRIDARLKIEPAPEPVSFDTRLEVASGQYIVSGE